MNKEQLQIRFDILTKRYNSVITEMRENGEYSKSAAFGIKYLLMTEMQITKEQIEALDAMVVNSKSPSTDKVYNEGWEAAFEGKMVWDNPYSSHGVGVDIESNERWLEGLRDGRKQIERTF